MMELPPIAHLAKDSIRRNGAVGLILVVVHLVIGGHTLSIPFIAS